MSDSNEGSEASFGDNNDNDDNDNDNNMNLQIPSFLLGEQNSSYNNYGTYNQKKISQLYGIQLTGDETYVPECFLVDGMKSYVYNYFQKKLNLDYILCAYCEKYYDVPIILWDDDGGMRCKHCHFLFGYDKNNRLNFDKCNLNGNTIVDYVIECNEKHDVDRCERKHIGCFLCDYRNGIVIENIVHPEKLYKNHNFRRSVYKQPNMKCTGDTYVKSTDEIPTSLSI